MFDDRFRKVFSDVEIELVQALPVINCNREVTFFYRAEPCDDKSIKIEGFEHIFVRNIKTGDMQELDKTDTAYTFADKCVGEVMELALVGEEAYELEEEYYERYEKAYEEALTGGTIDAAIMERLKEILYTFVPEGALRELYEYLWSH